MAVRESSGRFFVVRMKHPEIALLWVTVWTSLSGTEL